MRTVASALINSRRSARSTATQSRGGTWPAATGSRVGPTRARPAVAAGPRQPQEPALASQGLAAPGLESGPCPCWSARPWSAGACRHAGQVSISAAAGLPGLARGGRGILDRHARPQRRGACCRCRPFRGPRHAALSRTADRPSSGPKDWPRDGTHDGLARVKWPPPPHAGAADCLRGRGREVSSARAAGAGSRRILTGSCSGLLEVATDTASTRRGRDVDTAWTRHRGVGVAGLAAGHGLDAVWTRLRHGLDTPAAQTWSGLAPKAWSPTADPTPTGGSHI
jgi:hypothetical protein